jgi:heavy metal translocating P-type ATPase
MPVDTHKLSVEGMDCAGCARSVQSALKNVSGVRSADVRLVAGQVVVEAEEGKTVDPDALQQAVTAVGYRVRESDGDEASGDGWAAHVHRNLSLGLLGGIVVVVLSMAVVGHGLGVFEWVQTRIPWPVGGAAVLLLGYPVFKKVAQATWQRSITAHTLMTVGVVAALAVGEWVTALIIVVFMRVGDFVEQFTTDQARDSVRALVDAMPQTARVLRDGAEVDVPVDAVAPGDVAVVRPGEKIPVDGTVIDGRATINQAAITGEPMPVEATAGDRVFAATIAQGGGLRVQAEETGEDTTYGRVIRMVEEAEAHQGVTQRWADQFSGYYLPVVALVAIGTYLVQQEVMTAIAVLVVACSCAFALATPVAMLASIGTAARDGLLIKGGKYVEALAQADVLLLDKTGTLTMGAPRVTQVVTLNGVPRQEVLRLAASAEQFSEHPLADAVRDVAAEHNLSLSTPRNFEAIPGKGIRATVEGKTITVGNRALIDVSGDVLIQEGETPLFVAIDGIPAGVLLAADTVRDGVAEALDVVRRDGLEHIELLTGDTEQAGSELAEKLGIACRAELLPEDKIDVVKAHQAEGRTVVMIGDGVNDAPALAQADAGIAMGSVGTDVAVDAAHVVLMREDWALVPQLFRTADRTLGVVKSNLVLTAVYNAGALSLAALGWLPPVIAAALHALPDLGILANSSRLLRR